MYLRHFHQFNERGGDFLSSFLSNLLAGILIAFLASFLIPIYLDYRKRPILKFKNRLEGRDEYFSLINSQDGKWESTLEMTIKNEGIATINGAYWALILPRIMFSHSKINDDYNDDYSINHEIIDKNFLRLYGYIKKPIFPGRHFIFPWKFTIKVDEKKEYKGYYFFSTEFGTYPMKNYFYESGVNDDMNNKNYFDQIIIR